VLDSITFGLVGVSSREFFQSTPREARVINWVQFLQCQPQKICDGQKIAPNFSQFLTTFDFGFANISGKDQHIKNRKSSWSSTTHPTLGEKNLAYFGQQTKKLLTLINVHPNGLYSGDYISPPRGCCALKFLHALEIDQGYLAHTQTGTGVPCKKNESWKLKIWPKSQRVRLNNFRARGNILTGLFQSTPRKGGVIKWVQLLQCPPQKICDGQKIVPNFSRFLTTFDFDREYPRNGSTCQKSEKLLIIYNPSHLRRKKLGVLWSTNVKVIDFNKCTP